jgi:hypothetical protein
MWVVDLVIACRKAKQKERTPPISGFFDRYAPQRKEWKPTWYLRIRRLLRRRHERKIKERAETKRKL